MLFRIQFSTSWQILLKLIVVYKSYFSIKIIILYKKQFINIKGTPHTLVTDSQIVSRIREKRKKQQNTQVYFFNFSSIEQSTLTNL